MPTTCNIQLCREHEYSCYVDEDDITVTATLKTTEAKKVKEISIRCYGRAKVRFVPDDGNREVKDMDRVIDEYATVHGTDLLPAGTHTYEQTFSLPFGCLTSIESEFGHIRYEIWVIVHNVDEPDNIFIKPISVIRTVDLQEYPVYNKPLQFRNLHLDCGCGAHRSIYCLTTRFGAYVPGQVVEFTFEACNKAAENVKAYNIKLMKRMKFSAVVNAKIYTKRTENDLVSIFFDDNGRSEQTTRGRLVIPSVPQTCQEWLISVEYFLVATAALSRCKNNLNIIMPLVIGTEPLAASLQPNRSAEDLRPDAFALATSGDVTFKDLDVDEKQRIDDFIPTYPLYTSL